MADEDGELRARLDDFVGRLMHAAPAVSPDPVNIPMIRHWVDAIDDRNPVYLDEAIAASTRFGGVVAPPAMLQTWTMARPTIQGLAERGGAPGPVGPGPLRLLDDAGYTATRATDSELEFDRYLRPGDRLQASTVIESIAGPKQTALGTGWFVTWVTTYATTGMDADGAEEGEVVGRQRFRILKFRPSARVGGA